MNERILYTDNNGGVVIIVPTGEVSIEQVVATSVPAGKFYEIVDKSIIPLDRTFRNAWEKQGVNIVENLSKARELAHDKRRKARSKEFAPYDDIVAKQITEKDKQAAEVERQKIRDKYAALQVKMDAAKTVDELKNLLPKG